MKKTTQSFKNPWEQVDLMTEEEQYQAAISDPDAEPITVNNIKCLKRTPQAKVIRQALQLTQEDFSQKFHIPLGTLRDWEQGRKIPDAAAKAYLIVIARRPHVVSQALSS